VSSGITWGLGDGVSDGIGDGLAVGAAANKFVPSTKKVDNAIAATAIIPITIIIFLFFALVSGLFLPHSGLTWFWLLRNLRERGMSKTNGYLFI